MKRHVLLKTLAKIVDDAFNLPVFEMTSHWGSVLKWPVQAILSVRPNPSQVTMTIVLAAMTVWGLTLDIHQWNPIIMHAIVDFANTVDSLLHTMAIESDGWPASTDNNRLSTVVCRDIISEDLINLGLAMPNYLADNITGIHVIPMYF